MPTWAQAVYGATKNSMLRFLKSLRTPRQSSHEEPAANALAGLPWNSHPAASARPRSYKSQASRFSRISSAYSLTPPGPDAGSLTDFLGWRPGKTNTGLMRSFSNTWRSFSTRMMRARGTPPVAERKGSSPEEDSRTRLR